MRLTSTRIMVDGQLVKLPRRSGAKSEAAIIQAADAIVAGYARHYTADKAGGDKGGRMGAWLLPACLGLIEYCEDTQQTGVLRARIKAYNRKTDRERLVDLLVLGIFAPDRTFTAHNISYYSNRIYYALRHYVPSVFVNGFISQLPGFADKESYESLEPGFEDWVISQRWLDFKSSQLRGHYPPRLYKKINRLRSTGLSKFASLFKVKKKKKA